MRATEQLCHSLAPKILGSAFSRRTACVTLPVLWPRLHSFAIRSNMRYQTLILSALTAEDQQPSQYSMPVWRWKFCPYFERKNENMIQPLNFLKKNRLHTHTHTHTNTNCHQRTSSSLELLRGLVYWKYSHWVWISRQTAGERSQRCKINWVCYRGCNLSSQYCQHNCRELYINLIKQLLYYIYYPGVSFGYLLLLEKKLFLQIMPLNLVVYILKDHLY